MLRWIKNPFCKSISVPSFFMQNRYIFPLNVSLWICYSCAYRITVKSAHSRAANESITIQQVQSSDYFRPPNPIFERIARYVTKNVYGQKFCILISKAPIFELGCDVVLGASFRKSKSKAFQVHFAL